SYSIPMGMNLLQVRGGAMYETGAAPNSWTRADLDGQARIILGTGVAYRFGRFMADLGFAYGIVASRTVAEVTDPMLPTPQRGNPDPIQPLQDSGNQQFGAFTAGTYDAAHWLGMVGFTVNL